jgi:hypothetical protein
VQFDFLVTDASVGLNRSPAAFRAKERKGLDVFALFDGGAGEEDGGSPSALSAAAMKPKVRDAARHLRVSTTDS